jgi:hypothetical protein
LADGPLVVGAATYNSLGAWQVAGQDAASAAVDPHFVAAPGNGPDDYKLSVGSPAQGLGADLSSLLTQDYFGDPLPPPALTPWDPGFHVLAAVQYTPTPTPVLTPAQPTATPSITASPTVTPDSTPSPPGTLTSTPTISPTFTLTPTLSPTPLPLKPGRIISYPNPYKPEAGPLRFVFDPAQRASLRLYDMATALVCELPASAIQASLGTALWDGRDRSGQPVPNGLYLCVLATEGGSKFTRFTVLH